MAAPNNKKRRVRNFVITHNNWTEADITIWKSLDFIKYGLMGKEIGATGTPHLQGYIQLRKQMTLTALQKRLKDSFIHCYAHEANAGYEENSKYCSKDDNVVEWGVPKAGGKNSTRTDLADFRDAIKAGKSELEILEEFPKQLIRYPSAYDRINNLYRNEETLKELEDQFKDNEGEGREWQLEVMEKVPGQNSRDVCWIVDKQGNNGKTWLAKWFLINEGAFICMGGKKTDIGLAWNKQTTCVFDLARDKKDYFTYGAIEAFKNGMVDSPKYQSCLKLSSPCKVLVLSNWEPDKSKLSPDRWDVGHILDGVVYWEREQDEGYIWYPDELGVTNAFVFAD